MAMTKTEQQYKAVTDRCREIFLKKAQDYGTSWRVLRAISIADQIYIKAQRIRTIQENKSQRIADPVAGEFMGIVNYGIIALIQDALPADAPIDLPYSEVEKYYDQYLNATMRLMQDKNTDYGEAWRSMSQESFVDLILVKLLRIKQIIANDGQTIISEGADANFTDIINYAVFALIRQEEAAG